MTVFKYWPILCLLVAIVLAIRYKLEAGNLIPAVWSRIALLCFYIVSTVSILGATSEPRPWLAIQGPPILGLLSLAITLVVLLLRHDRISKILPTVQLC